MLSQSAGQQEIQKQVAMVESKLRADPACMQAMQDVVQQRDGLQCAVATLEATVRDLTQELERMRGEVIVLRSELDATKPAAAAAAQRADEVEAQVERHSLDKQQLAAQLHAVASDWRVAGVCACTVHGLWLYCALCVEV